MINFSLGLPYFIERFLKKMFGSPTMSFYREGAISRERHKFWEFQIAHVGWPILLSFELDLRLTGCDHAGPALEIVILGFMVRTNIYDSRHWDYDAGDWEQYDPQEDGAASNVLPKG